MTMWLLFFQRILNRILFLLTSFRKLKVNKVEDFMGEYDSVETFDGRGESAERASKYEFSEKTRKLHERAGYIINNDGSIEFEVKSKWSPGSVMVKDGPNGPEIRTAKNIEPLGFCLEQTDSGDYEVRFNQFLEAYNVLEARSFAEEADYSRFVARDAVAAVNQVRRARLELFGPGENTTEVKIRPLDSFQPIPEPGSGFHYDLDQYGRPPEVISTLDGTNRTDLRIVSQVSDEYGASVRICPPFSTHKLTDGEYQEYIYTMKRAIHTGTTIIQNH